MLVQMSRAGPNQTRPSLLIIRPKQFTIRRPTTGIQKGPELGCENIAPKPRKRMSFIAFLVPFSMLDLQEWKYEYEFIFIPDVLLRAESEAAWNWPNCRHDTSETGSQERGVHLKPVFCSYKHEGTNVWKIVVIVRPCKASLIGDDVRLWL